MILIVKALAFRRVTHPAASLQEAHRCHVCPRFSQVAPILLPCWYHLGVLQRCVCAPHTLHQYGTGTALVHHSLERETSLNEKPETG